ncbi:histone-arginine methyltransferase METTL23 isoform X1 [Patella vulgata]|uniref:histone-arginine methyltransferase METTL23 isoform X1 n=1 Tax=Patella vulgata TaxID=6465 RepID=UPI00218070A6|nr:histone-arginine methyltransferase METTL23 isoform X1 [Patella vulgata]
MESTKKFTFTDNDNELSVIIPEYVDPKYGMYTWPCAPVLAQYIWMNRHIIKTKKVLEIGAGTALPGIVAAKCGADVILSDSSFLDECQRNCIKSCEANHLMNIPVVGITWGAFDPSLLELGSIDIILASDCFYETKDFEDVLVTISYILQRNNDCQFWCTYQERSADRSIEHLLYKWGLQSLPIPLEEFGANIPNIAGSSLPGSHTINMYIITKKIPVE